MPFTFAHPAVVIPVQRALRQRVILSALVIGSMAPDFQNFLPFDVERADSHSLAGMFWFSLPVGMALYLAFHLLLKKPLCALLPPAIAARLAPVARPALPSASGAIVVLSLLLGILTHLAWDALTHHGFVTVDILPVLTMHLFSVGGYHVYPYKLLQHASSIGGALLLWHWSRQWLRRAPIPPQQPPILLSRRWRHAAIALLLAAPPMVGCARATHTWLFSYGPTVVNDLVREAVVTAISSCGLLFIIYSLACHCLHWQRMRAPSRHGDSSPLPATDGKRSMQKTDASEIK